MAFAVPIASWWIIGDLSFSDDLNTVDYMWRQPAIDPTIASLAGFVALLLSVGSLLILVRAARHRVLDPRC